MPSGYTAPVHDGTVTEFPAFALLCARAMGACILMRDEPLNAPIPEEFKPSDYHERCLATAQAELKRVKALTPAEADAEAAKEHEERCAAHREIRERQALVRQRYEGMLAKVEAWEPPGDDHANFKKFMQDQLHESLRFDTGFDSPDPAPRSGAEWRQEKARSLLSDIEYHAKHHKEEVARTNSRTLWLRQLRDSLK